MASKLQLECRQRNNTKFNLKGLAAEMNERQKRFSKIAGHEKASELEVLKMILLLCHQEP